MASLRRASRTGADAVKIQDWDYRRVVLRQDEVAEFIRSRKGESNSAPLPVFGLHELEVAAENLRRLARFVETSPASPERSQPSSKIVR